MRTSVSTPSTPTSARWLFIGLMLLALVAGWPARARAQSLPDFTELVERVGPAVVNIRTLERSKPGASGGAEVDPQIEEFFRRFGIPMPGRPDPRRGPRGGGDDEPQQRGVGSGFIFSADGFVMTNAHVVDGADEVLVTLTDKREFKARIIGADRRTDVAVVKLEATGLPFVKIGDSDKLKVGEWVVAIGSPFGLENTVTAGIVSAKQRDTGDYLPFIQTDVAINPGNSGGPLLNLRGEVVGINSQIFSRSGGYMGISFAIPMADAMRVSEQLRANGRVIRGRIGVQIAPVNKEVAESIGLGKPTGALGAKRRSRRAGRQGRCRGRRHHHQGGWQGGGEVRRPAAVDRRHQARQQDHAAGLSARWHQGHRRHRERVRGRSPDARGQRTGGSPGAEERARAGRWPT